MNRRSFLKTLAGALAVLPFVPAVGKLAADKPVKLGEDTIGGYIVPADIRDRIIEHSIFRESDDDNNPGAKTTWKLELEDDLTDSFEWYDLGGVD